MTNNNNTNNINQHHINCSKSSTKKSYNNNQRKLLFTNGSMRVDYYCLVILLSIILTLHRTVLCEKFYLYHNNRVRVLYQSGIKSEAQLPQCEPWTVCSKVDTYSIPWVERHCRCQDSMECSNSLDHDDGHTIGDKTRQYKMCEPIKKLSTCNLFRDITWTLTSYPDNSTSQKVNCVCPKNSVAYIFKHQVFQTKEGEIGYKYHFACSPESKLRCQRKEPCRLFTVRKRPGLEEVNTNTLCQCPRGSRCPTHHTDLSVIAGTVYPADHIKTFSGYCSIKSKSIGNKLFNKGWQSLDKMSYN